MSPPQFVVLVLAVCSVSAHAATFFGGASSFRDFAVDIVTGYNVGKSSKVPPYDSVGSALGVSGFLSGKYAIGASDAPLSAKEDTTANGLCRAPKKGKFTIPICLSTFTFATLKASNVKLTGSQISQMYKGALTSWSSIASGSSGTIVPVARADGSGSTNVINTFLKASAGWNLVGDDSWKGKAGISSRVVFASRSSGIISALLANRNAIGYVVTGLAIKAKLYQSAIMNKAKKYVIATNADPVQSIPRPLPQADKSWSGVTLVFKTGLDTYPVVSFEYTFMRKCGGYLVKNFMSYTQTSAVQNLLNNKYDNQFFRLPGYVTGQNVAAIKLIY